MFSHCCLVFFRRGAAKLRCAGGAQRLLLCVNEHKKAGCVQARQNLTCLHIFDICCSCPNDQTSAFNGPFGHIGSVWWICLILVIHSLCIFNFVLKILQVVQSLGRSIRSLFRQQVVSLSQSSYVSLVELTDGGSLGEKPNHKFARKPSPL